MKARLILSHEETQALYDLLRVLSRCSENQHPLTASQESQLIEAGHALKVEIFGKEPE